MSIIRTMNVYDFADAFARMDRDYFSNDGYQYLYDFYDESSDGNWELDVVAVCCEWTEYDNIDDFLYDYGMYLDDVYDEDELMECTNKEKANMLYEFLSDRTLITQLDNGNYLMMTF